MDYQKLLDVIRESVVSDIFDIMNKYGISELDIDDFSEGDSPILFEDQNDSNLTYTLDKIRIVKDLKWNSHYLDFEGSSCWDNADWHSDTMPIETLIGIYDWLLGYEGEIKRAYQK